MRLRVLEGGEHRSLRRQHDRRPDRRGARPRGLLLDRVSCSLVYPGGRSGQSPGTRVPGCRCRWTAPHTESPWSARCSSHLLSTASATWTWTSASTARRTSSVTCRGRCRSRSSRRSPGPGPLPGSLRVDDRVAPDRRPGDAGGLPRPPCSSSPPLAVAWPTGALDGAPAVHGDPGVYSLAVPNLGALHRFPVRLPHDSGRARNRRRFGTPRRTAGPARPPERFEPRLRPPPAPDATRRPRGSPAPRREPRIVGRSPRSRTRSAIRFRAASPRRRASAGSSSSWPSAAAIGSGALVSTTSPASPWRDELLDPPDRRGHAGQAEGHGLHEDVGHPLVQRRQHERVGRLQHAGQVRPVPEQMNARRERRAGWPASRARRGTVHRRR